MCLHPIPLLRVRKPHGSGEGKSVKPQEIDDTLNASPLIQHHMCACASQQAQGLQGSAPRGVLELKAPITISEAI